ncbi:tryptophan synthase subunit alpha [Taibaiella koreensis]|uniref:tryptophan synthase subunit alpha n=1 Tax=Taibaiella koreensis TaxID=1268548 RepID=UPI000E59B5EB|nr:tryptophan synthase subunit alpha [Taibaiella koreensis]
MNRIQSLFEQKENKVLSFYCTAGYPRLQDTLPVLTALQAAGADMIEIGIPFSDPLADGPVIQESSAVALANGMNLQELFRQLKDVREQVSVPLILMGYLNPLLQYGVSRFCRDAAACGIDGLIIPDLPLEEYRREWQHAMEAYGLNMIFLVTPFTPQERLREIDECSSGFLYMVTTAGTTGGSIGPDEATKRYFSFIKEQRLNRPVMAGFGIRDKPGFDQACAYVNGAIVGSGLIRVLQQYPDKGEIVIRDFVHSFF